MTFKEYLESMNACQEAVDWVGDKPLNECWQTCDMPDWMLWLYGRNNPDKTTCVKIAVFAARLVLPIWQEKYPDDKCTQQAIEAAEKWTENPSEENRQAAEAAAWAAAAAAARAARAAAAAAARAAEAAMAAEAARDNVNKTIADYIRTLIPTINIPEVIDEKSV